MRQEQGELNNDWTQKGACRGAEGIFFPEYGERAHIKIEREALAGIICKNCIVLNECRDYVEKNPEYGYWAGMSEEERFRADMPLPSNAINYLKKKSIKAS